MANVNQVKCPYCGTKDNPQNVGLGNDNAVGPDGLRKHHLWVALKFFCCKRVALAYVNNATTPSTIRCMFPAQQAIRAPNHLPDAILADFQEAAACLANNLPRACALMARRCIEAACENKKCKKGNLYESIDELHAQEHILSHMKDAAHKIRLLGNEAAHEIGFQDDAPPTQELQAVLAYVRALLVEMYELPAESSRLLPTNQVAAAT